MYLGVENIFNNTLINAVYGPKMLLQIWMRIYVAFWTLDIVWKGVQILSNIGFMSQRAAKLLDVKVGVL